MGASVGGLTCVLQETLQVIRRLVRMMAMLSNCENCMPCSGPDYDVESNSSIRLLRERGLCTRSLALSVRAM